jgi:hypothetical protein
MTPIPPTRTPDTSTQSARSEDARANKPPCKHPRVQIVARDEDSEYVECLECREVFESSEFKDMAIEETKLQNES